MLRLSQKFFLKPGLGEVQTKLDETQVMLRLSQSYFEASFKSSSAKLKFDLIKVK